MMMKYRIHTSLNDKYRDAPPFEIEVVNKDTMETNYGFLGMILVEELCDDYGTPFGPGVTLTVERVE